jgi:hypothetical protein
MGKRAIRFIHFLFLIVILPFLVTCSSGGDSGGGLSPDEYSAELFSTTRVIDDQVLGALIEVTDDGTYHFSGTPAGATAVAADDVIIGGVSDKTPYGFLRYVTSVETAANGDLLLHTVPAPVQMAFRKLHVKLARSIPDIGAAVTGKAGPLKVGNTPSKISGGVWPPALSVDYFPFNGDKDPSSEDDQVHVTGTLSGGVDYTFGLDVDWGAVENIPDNIKKCAETLFISCDPLPEAIVDFGISGSLKADLATKGVSFLPYTKDVPVYGPIYLTPPITIGLLTFLPEFEISSKIEGSASSQFDIGMSMEADAGVGVSISSKKLIPDMNPAPYATIAISAPTVDATLDAYSKVRLGPQISLKLWGFAGPRAGLFGFAELSASQDNIAQGQPCYTLYGGVEGELGFTIGVDFPIFGSVVLADWNLTNNLWTEESKSGACSGGSNVQQNPLQNPTFTPWAKAYSNTVAATGMPSSAPSTIGGTDLQPTIDGRYTVAGSGSKGLLKIDETGNAIWAKRITGPTLGDAFITELMPDHTTYTQDAAMFVTAYPWAVLKVDAGGDLVWAKQFALTPNDDWWRISSLAADDSGGLYLAAGYGTDAAKPLDIDALVARLDADGDVLWLRRIGDAGVGEVPRIVIPFHDGIVVAGTKCTLNASSTCGAWTLWAIDLDNSGAILWSRTYPLTASGASTIPLSGQEAADGDLILGGTIENSPQRSFFAKIKPDGSMAFLIAYKKVDSLNLEDLSLTSFVPLPTSGYLATGTYTPYPYSLGKDMWLASLDGVGQVQWIERIRTPDDTPVTVPPTGSEELMPAIQYTSDGGALVTGYTGELAGGGTGFWSLKAFAKDGTISFTSSSGVSVEALNVTNDTANFCSSQCAGVGSTWSPLVQDLPVTFAASQVTFADLPVTVSQQSP